MRPCLSMLWDRSLVKERGVRMMRQHCWPRSLSMAPLMALALTMAMVLLLTAPRPVSAQEVVSSQISEADADKAAVAIAQYCKTLVGRMGSLIDEDWATQDLVALAQAWQALRCHQVFGFEPVPVVNPGVEDQGRSPRWIIR